MTDRYNDAHAPHPPTHRELSEAERNAAFADMAAKNFFNAVPTPEAEMLVAKAVKNLLLGIFTNAITKDDDGEWVFEGVMSADFLTAYHLRLLAEILDEKNAK